MCSNSLTGIPTWYPVHYLPSPAAAGRAEGERRRLKSIQITTYGYEQGRPRAAVGRSVGVPPLVLLRQRFLTPPPWKGNNSAIFAL